MNIEVINKMKEIAGEDWVLSDLSQMAGYLYDETEPTIRPKANEDCIVVKPQNAPEISEIVKYANEKSISVVPRGGGTGLSGAAIPLTPSIIISLERLNNTIDIDEENLMVTVDCGVTLAALIEKIDKHESLFLPVHSGDDGAQIGGLVVENAGGVRAVKHGIVRNHVKGLEVVLPTGEIVQMGGKLLKNNMGYDLMHLMIGSEGTLGIVTKVIFKLYSKMSNTMTLIASFDNNKDAASVVPRILQQGITPLAAEYLDKINIEKISEHTGLKWPLQDGNAFLIFILDGESEDELFGKSERIAEACESYNALECVIAESSKEQRAILEFRSKVYPAFCDELVETLDIAVAPSLIPDIIDDLTEIAKKYNTITPICGHVGDGNIHNMILRVNGEKPPYFEEIKLEMLQTAMKYGGTVTAEHGTGKIKKKYMGLQYSDREIEIMKGIKRVFDPHNILCPGNIFDN